MTINERLAALRTKFRSKDTMMNGLEIMDHYKALFAHTNEPSTIPFVTMYRALVLLSTGKESLPVRSAWGRGR